MDESLANVLVKAGFRSAIIRLHTGLTRKQVTSLRKKLGVCGPSESGPLPNAESLLVKRAVSLEASLFMLAYLITADKPREAVDIHAVMAAHTQYLDSHSALRGGNLDLENILELDDAWLIARDYRSQEVTMRSCSNCHIEFVASINHRRHACPLCEGVQVRDPFHCDVADRAVSTRNVGELIEISVKVSQWENWGYKADEIKSEFALSEGELVACRKLLSLADDEIKRLCLKFQTGDRLVKYLIKAPAVRGHGLQAA